MLLGVQAAVFFCLFVSWCFFFVKYTSLDLSINGLNVDQIQSKIRNQKNDFTNTAYRLPFRMNTNKCFKAKESLTKSK